MIALTRAVPPSIARCELTHLARAPIDLERARAQHEAYEETLADLGCTIERLAEEPDLPDSVFVEDTAVVLDEVAVITHPGAASRRAETTAVASALAAHRPLCRIEAPATLDGGDVLRVGRRLWVGRSERSNDEGIGRLAQLLGPQDYRVEAMELRDCLHLKTAVTAVSDGLLLANPAWLGDDALAAFGAAGLDVVEVDPEEPFAANALRIGATVVFPAAFARTAERLRRRGLALRTVEVDEIAKAEGGVTCCSLVFATAGPA